MKIKPENPFGGQTSQEPQPRPSAERDDATGENRIEGEYAMNLLTNYDKTVAAMVLIEGPDWLEKQKTFGINSIEGALKEGASGGMIVPGIIYGSGGCNRYFVYGNGDVVYSRFQGYATLEQAISLGFRTT